MTSPSITIVTPWHDHLELSEDYWKAVANTEARVLVIDNGSDPPLPNAIRLEENAGYSKASNIGLHYARTEAVLFLNNDIYMTSSDWMQRLMDELEPGVLVGRNLRYDPHADVDGERMPYIDGWCIAGMTEDLQELGGFDESLEEPAYYADNLLCLEARAMGMSLREVVCGIEHKGGKTSNANGYLLPSTIANRKVYEDRARELM